MTCIVLNDLQQLRVDYSLMSCPPPPLSRLYHVLLNYNGLMVHVSLWPRLPSSSVCDSLIIKCTINHFSPDISQALHVHVLWLARVSLSPEMPVSHHGECTGHLLTVTVEWVITSALTASRDRQRYNRNAGAPPAAQRLNNLHKIHE